MVVGQISRRDSSDQFDRVFNDDGFMATGSTSGRIRILDLQSLELRPVSSPLEKEIISIALSPVGKLVAAGGEGNKVHIWNCADGTRICEPIECRDTIRQVTFSPDGQLLAIASFDSTVRLWNLLENRQHGMTMNHDGPVFTVAFDRQGRFLASGGGSKVRIWDIDTTQEICSPKQHQGMINRVVFSPSGELVCSASNDGTTRVWLTQPQPNRPFPLKHTQRVWSVDFSADGKLLATASDNGSGNKSGDASIWDIASRKRQQLFNHSETLLVALFRPRRNQLLTVSQRSLKLWDLQTEKLLWTSKGHIGQLRCAKFSPNGDYVITGCDGPKAILIDLRRLPGEYTTIEHPKWISDVAFHPSGKRFATACDDGLVRIYNLNSYSRPHITLKHNGEVHAVAFSPDGELVATAASDLAIRLWKSQDGAPVGKPIFQSTPVNSLTFGPENRLLASANKNGRIQMLDIITGLRCGAEIDLSFFCDVGSF